MLAIQKRLSNIFYIILGLPSTAMGFALSIQIAVLSWILRTKYNLEIDQIGIVWAAGPIAGILGQPIIGLISDKAWFWGGRRKPFIIIGGILAALMIFALPNIDKISNFFGIASIMAVAITVALTLDLSINISFNPTRSIIADVTPDGQPRTKGYTWMQSISNLFGSGAYLMGALIGNYFLIYAGVIIVLVFSIGPLLFIEEPRVLADSAKDEELKSGGRIIQNVFRPRIFMAGYSNYVCLHVRFSGTETTCTARHVGGRPQYAARADDRMVILYPQCCRCNLAGIPARTDE
ncbi:MAG: MFS transporter [Bacteroidetes bacterium]|nr:MFS transporter [Bacteroidota bacterium]